MNNVIRRLTTKQLPHQLKVTFPQCFRPDLRGKPLALKRVCQKPHFDQNQVLNDHWENSLFPSSFPTQKKHVEE